MLENTRPVILHEMTYYLKSMNPVKKRNNGFRLNDYVVELTCLRDKDVTSLHLRDQVFVPVHKIMNSLSRAPKLMRDIIYRRPRLEYANNMVSLIF